MVTAFQKRVFDTIVKIPKGRVSTYKLVGEAMGCRCAQAVGQALRRNPFAPRVPCHRVIASDLTLGGFGGKRSGPLLKKKARLLAREGVRLENGRLADSGQLYRFPRRRRRAR
ncbi:MAG: MGMT family protein [Kiritimatiellae bacterium]|nr:MGMT family protein [Kiritimatiellia bacterium]